MRSMRRLTTAGLMAVLIALLVGLTGITTVTAEGTAHEVWVIDQSNTTADGGGTLYIYDGADLAGQDAAVAVPEVIDIGGATRTLCLAQTGTAPVRPHMLMFAAGDSRAILAFVGTGHVVFYDAVTRAPIRCIDVGAQAHAAFPAPDESYVVVANQNGKLLQRITTDYATDTYTLDGAATLNLATCTTPSGAACEDAALRPDNAPICPIIDSTSTFTFVTLRGGGMFVVDSTATPMAIVAEYDRTIVHPNGCGGVETGGTMYINSGGGTATNPLEFDLYAFSLSAFSTTPSVTANTPAPALVLSRDDQGDVDSHGAVLTKSGRFLWLADRMANLVVVVDTASDTVVGEFSLLGGPSSDPAPDLLGIAPDGNRVYATLRGPNPLTGNAPGVNNAVGATPGLGVIRVMRNGMTGAFQAIAPISHRDAGGVERADPHAIGVRLK
jgi:DNA-binding beta-propeller fold protein YncE